MRVTEYQPPSHSVENFKLNFLLHAKECWVQSQFLVRRQAHHTSDELVLNGIHLQLKSVKVDGQIYDEKNYEVTNENLRLRNLSQAEHVIEIETIIDPYNNKSLEGLYYSNGIVCTQCEAESFRKITYFLDRPDVMTTFEVRIEADQKQFPVLLSNGNLVQQGSCGNGRHFSVWKDPSLKPCYLFALVAGDLACMKDEFITKSGKKVSLQFFAGAEKIQQCQFALDSLKHAMAWDERVFDLEYDLDQYMVVSIDDFNAGAMENKGLNIFNSKYVLADLNSATDEDFEHIESVIAHEYFHNYSGNRVTLRDWFHLSLKEGLTVFRDQEFSADRLGVSLQRVATVNSLKSRQFTEDAGPNRHPVLPFEGKAVDNFFTATIYEKGAEVIRMIQVILGKKQFQKILKSYFKKFDGQAITILDFVQHFQDESGFDFSQFKNWYFQSGTPVVKVRKSFSGSELKISFEQDLSQNRNHHVLDQAGSPTAATPYVIPVAIGYQASEKAKNLQTNSDGESFFMLDQTRGDLVLPWGSGARVSLFQNFSAPVLVQNQETLSDQIRQFREEADAFNSCEGADVLHSAMMVADELPFTDVRQFCTALKEKITAPEMLPGVKAKLLSLPSFQSLSTQVNLFDPDFMLRRWRDYRKILASELKTELLAELENCNLQMKQVPNIHAYSPESAGWRNYEYFLLETLGPVAQDLVTETAKQLLSSRKNFNDVTSALRLLAESQDVFPVSEFLSELRRWENNPLVQGKVFRLASTATSLSVPDALHDLMKQNFYDKENPNHVYSMVRGFFENYVVFHHSSHFRDHYAFMADQLRQHDRSNPQVAARLAVAFQLNGKLPVGQKSSMRETLQTLQGQSFSTNLQEKVVQAMAAL